MARSAANERRRQNLENTQKAKDQEVQSKRKRLDRLGNNLVEWEEQIEVFETALAPFRHSKGTVRTKEQIVMALETTLFFMKQARLDAEHNEDTSLLSLKAVHNSAASHCRSKTRD